MKQGLLLLGLVHIASLWAVDIDRVVHDVHDVMQREGPVAAVGFGYNACAGKTAGEIIGYTLGGAVGGELLGMSMGLDFDMLSDAGRSFRETVVTKIDAAISAIGSTEAAVSKVDLLLPAMKTIAGRLGGLTEVQTQGLLEVLSNHGLLDQVGSANELVSALKTGINNYPSEINTVLAAGNVSGLSELVSAVEKELVGARPAILGRPAGLTAKIFKEMAFNGVAGSIENVGLTEAEALYIAKEFIQKSSGLDEVTAARLAPQLVESLPRDAGVGEISAGKLAEQLTVDKVKGLKAVSVDNKMISPNLVSSREGTGLNFIERNLLTEDHITQIRGFWRELLMGSTPARAMKVAGAAAGTVAGLGTSVGLGVNAVDQCYQAVEKATGFVVDKSLYDGPRLGFMSIDNQTGNSIAVKLHWVGWTQPQEFVVQARGAKDRRTVWTLGPAMLDRIELNQEGRTITLYRRGIVAINQVIGATVRIEDGTLKAHDLVGVSLT